MNHLKSFLRYSALVALSLTLLSTAFAAEESKWDVAPSVKKSVAPDPPKGLEGMVSARVDIDESGLVTNATISKSTDPSLEACVLEAVRKWRFAPAKLDGKAIACTIKVPFRIKI